MKFTVTGRVQPERACVRFDKVIWSNERGSISVACEVSQLLIVIDDPSVDNYLTAYGTAEHISQTVLSALGYALACGYKSEILHVIDEHDVLYVVGVKQDTLTFPSHDDIFSWALEKSRHDLYLRFAIQDYTSAIVDRIGCAHLCFRAVESISKAVGQTKIDKQNWKRMHEILLTDEETITATIKKYADDIRHGNWDKFVPTTEQQRVDMLNLTRDIIAKYMGLIEQGIK